MAFLNTIQRAEVEKKQVYLAALVEFDFPEGIRRAWDGFGILNAGGVDWIGTGVLGSISSISFGENDSADKVTFQLSGVDPEFVTLARAGASVRGRDVTIYGQFLAADTLAPLDAKWTVRQLVMDTIGYGAKGPTERSISLTAETIWTARNLAAFAYWSDRDQKARYPGDRGCEFVPTLRSKRVSWPTFILALCAVSALVNALGGVGAGIL